MDMGLKGVVGKEWPEEYKVAGKVMRSEVK
jgi:hypothetical protein